MIRIVLDVAQSSDELIKREIVDFFNGQGKLPNLRIFPQSSREDQALFAKGGLTFGVNGTRYGSCDAVWFTDGKWTDQYDSTIHVLKPLVALEGTDALNRGSSGNAQYQRFHHALGAVRNGVLGLYYFRKGIDQIQPDLIGMAVAASRLEGTPYVVTNDLGEVLEIVREVFLGNTSTFVDDKIDRMEKEFKISFAERYSSDWNLFAKARSTIIFESSVIKYAGRNIRNFTESSQRAGHIAVGEMYLSKYFFPTKKIDYLFPRMTAKDLVYLDSNKGTDKEWFLLRNENNIAIRTLDDLKELDVSLYETFLKVRLEPLKGQALQTYTNAVKKLQLLLETKKVYIE